MLQQPVSRATTPWIVPSTNAQGERRILSVSVAPDLARRIQDLCYEGRATGKFPWKTPGEVHRWLLIKGLLHLAEALGETDDTLRFHQLDDAADRMATMRKAAHVLYDKLSIELEALIAIGEERRATQTLQLMVPEILKLESVEWREWLMKQLKHRFATLLMMPMPHAKLMRMRPDSVLKQKPKRGTR